MPSSSYDEKALSVTHVHNGTYQTSANRPHNTYHIVQADEVLEGEGGSEAGFRAQRLRRDDVEQGQ